MNYHARRDHEKFSFKLLLASFRTSRISPLAYAGYNRAIWTILHSLQLLHARDATNAYAFREPVCPREASAQKIRAGIVIPDCRGSPGVGGETGEERRVEEG